MPVAEQPQHLQANKRSAEVRTARRRQREALRGVTPHELAPAILHAPKPLDGSTLHALFGVARNTKGVIYGYSGARLRMALASLRREGHSWAHEYTRLRELSYHQRYWLLDAIFRTAPKAWRESA